MGEMTNTYKLKGTDHFGDIGRHGKTLLIWTLKEENLRL
jgi:hypothetical protein